MNTRRQFFVLVLILVVLQVAWEVVSNQRHVTYFWWSDKSTTTKAIESSNSSSAISRDSTIARINQTTILPSSSSSSPSFLVYYTHSGYSNQLIGLQQAAQLAYALNRTLVVGPVLPHEGDDTSKLLYPQWKSAAVGPACRANLNFQKVQRLTLDQANKARSHKGFPSFHSIMDFQALYSTTGLQVVDLDEFMKHTHKRSVLPKDGNSSIQEFLDTYYPQRKSHNESVFTWCNANLDRHVTHYKGPNSCTMKPPRSYPDLITYIQKQMILQDETLGKRSKGNGLVHHYRLDCRVVNIGSAFLVGNDFTDDPAASLFSRFFENYPLVEPWNQILRTLLQNDDDDGEFSERRLVGVHIRTLDGEKECHKSANLYTRAAQRILKLTNSNSNSGRTGSISEVRIVIGRVNSNSKLCLQSALKQEVQRLENKAAETGATETDARLPTVVTVNDMINQHVQKSQLLHWINKEIKLEVSTRYLLLDQFVLSLASELILESAYGGSTFQNLIKYRHAYRMENLKALGLLEED